MAKFDLGEAIRANPTIKERVKDFVPVKPVPRDVFQSPAPGTPLLKGMTVEVKLLSTSDVPLGSLIVDVPVAMKDVPISELAALMDRSPEMGALLAGGALAEDKRAEFVAGINRGLGNVIKTPLTDADASKTFSILKDFVR